jgi:hypothetical protein
MAQHRVTEVQNLLDHRGHIVEPGYATSPVWRYNKQNIHATPLRIKEWDYYLVTSATHGFAVTVSDLGFAGMVSVSWLDFANERQQTKTLLKPFTLGRWNLPRSSEEGSVDVRLNDAHIRFTVEDGVRHIQGLIGDFDDGKTLRFNLRLTPTMADSMCIATPWAESPTRFYYNQKINCLAADGWVDLGHRHRFSPDADLGVLDWGRGVWTYENRWYWATGSGMVNGEPFGLNLGYGFTDRSSASENMLFYHGVAHKLEDVTFTIPDGEDGQPAYLEPWAFNSSDGRIEGIFTPILDRAALMDFKLIVSNQHQLFGYFTGDCVLDGGEKLHLDNFLMAAEDVLNKY